MDIIFKIVISQIVTFLFSKYVSILVAPIQEKWVSIELKSSLIWKRSCLDLLGIWVFPKIRVPPNHPVLIGVSLINHPFWGTLIFGNIHMSPTLNLAPNKTCTPTAQTSI